MIQYQPIPEEKLAEINRIFVPDRENLGKDIGTTLLKALIEEIKEPKPYFDYEKPLALVAWAFRVPGRYPQHEFYQKRGRNF